MKKLIILFALLSSFSYAANDCPKLAGEYHCLIFNNRYSLLKIKQTQISEDVVHYSFDYSGIPGEPTIVPASNSGEPDEVGWQTRCAGDELRSIPQDASMMQEMFLDKEEAFVRVLNGKRVQRCPKKL